MVLHFLELMKRVCMINKEGGKINMWSYWCMLNDKKGFQYFPNMIEAKNNYLKRVG